MSRNRQPPAGGNGPALTPRALVERIVKEMIAEGALDEALQARLQKIADPLCGSIPAIAQRGEIILPLTRLALIRQVIRESVAKGAAESLHSPGLGVPATRSRNTFKAR